MKENHMTPGEIFSEVRKLNELSYDVCLTNDSCQVYDTLDGKNEMIIDADFFRTMYENAQHGLFGLYDKLVKKLEDSGQLEARKTRISLTHRARFRSARGGRGTSQE